jgi:uncharacterized protein YukE
MKVAVAFALVAACVAASYSAPAPRAVDWRAVGAKVGEIESTVRSAVQQIKSIATADNSQVGASIGSQLDAAAVKAEAVLSQAAAAIGDQSLTEAQARVLLGQLKDILAGIQADLQDELAQLTGTAAGQIRDLFYSTYAQAEQKAQELYALLAAFAPSAVNWTAVAAKVGEIETLVRSAVQQIKTIALADNSQVGASIVTQLDAAATKAEAVLAQAAAGIKDQSLTEAQARVLLGQLKDILAGVQADLQDELAQLTGTAAGQIRDLFYSTYAQAEQKAQELYALLAAFFPSAVNWTAVAAKVGEIETLVRSAVQQIKSIALADNSQVGASIVTQLDAAATKAEAVLAQAAAGIKDQSLTEAQARVLLGQLKDILAGVQSDLQDELAQLTGTAAGQIRDLFYSTYAQAEQKAQELYALLAAFAPSAVNWTSVAAKVGEIETLVRSAVQQIKTIALADNSQVGASIVTQLDAAATKAEAVLAQAAAGIKDQSLTEAQAKTLLSQLKDILAGVQSDLQDELAQLTGTAAGQIRDLFYSTYAQAEQKAQELYALLRQ